MKITSLQWYTSNNYWIMYYEKRCAIKGQCQSLPITERQASKLLADCLHERRITAYGHIIEYTFKY